MASWRKRCEWWREFRYLGDRDVKRRVEGVSWDQEKLREAERFLFWRDNRAKFFSMIIVALGVLIGLLNYLK